MKPFAYVLAAAVLVGAAVPAFAGDAQNLIDGVAIHGFDPVAYFVQKKPLKGDPGIVATYKGATYEFASAENKASFEKDPEKYVPQYGGFCAFAAANGAKADVDPHAYVVRGGKLYLNFSEAKNQVFSEKFGELSVAADRNWSSVKGQDKVYR
ncbi:YHS domain-containing (seleno)protein [Methyloraptor flagellatus]|uniref:YHS domain-containing (Seleno)protein n=1 Tax=Methyloraptor flagellatus TaxID=3162530 RepID=A0AAU7XDM4_9HYPH